LTHDCDYDDLGGDYFTRRNSHRQRNRLIAQLQGLGYRVTLDKAAWARCSQFTSKRTHRLHSQAGCRC